MFINAAYVTPRWAAVPQPVARIRPLLSSVEAPGAATAAPPPPAPAPQPAVGVLGALQGDSWGERETWALEDNVQRYQVDGGRVVLWRRMVCEVAELMHLQPAAVRDRWLATRGDSHSALPAAVDPPSLEDWICLDHDRYEGVVRAASGEGGGEGGAPGSRVVIEHDASCLRPDVRLGPGTCLDLDLEHEPEQELTAEGHRRYVVTSSARFFQLGRPAASELAVELAAAAALAPGGTARSADPWAASLDLQGVPAAADAAGGAALGAARAVTGPALRGAAVAAGVLLAAGAAWFVLGHHHVDVSVFIV